MDHVQLSPHAVHPPIQVPLFCPVDVTEPSFPFPLFPLLGAGWIDRDVFYRPNWTHRKPFDQETFPNRRGLDECTSFLQAWLFFAFLKAVFGPSLRSEDFIRTDTESGAKYVTTLHLAGYTERLEATQMDLTVEHQAQRKEIVDNTIIMAHQVLEFVCENTSVEEALLLSLGALGDYMTMLRKSIYWDRTPEDILTLWWPRGDITLSKTVTILGKRMFETGWCLSQYRRLLRFSPSAMYFLAGLPAPGSDKDHGKCTMWKCEAYQMDWRTYKTAHVQKDCTCRFLGAKSEEIAPIVQRGCIPLISFPESTGQQDYIKVRESSPGCKYVAISHVWSDGLGNPFANALPLCQLEHISSIVNQLYEGETEPVHFWIDTICCPREPMWARQKAIGLMADTYNMADKVLVLDNYMHKTPAKEMSDFERVARVFCSGWTQRLWTLQEGVLSKRLFIQYADMALDLMAVHASIETGKKSRAEYHEMGKGILTIRGPWIYARTPQPFTVFQNLVQAVHERSTSVSTDEALCLGALWGVDVDKLMEVPAEERMRQFWSLQESLTGELIFWTGSRLSDKGYRWAPSSFMNQILEFMPTNLQFNKDSPAFRSENGLLVKYPGVILAPPPREYPVARQFWVLDNDKNWKYFFVHRGRRDGGSEQESIINLAPAANSAQNEKSILLALIFSGDPESLASDKLNGTKVEAVLVSIDRRDKQTVTVHIEAPGALYISDVGNAPPLARFLPSKDQLRPLAQDLHMSASGLVYDNQCRAFEGEWLGRDQKWCVD